MVGIKVVLLRQPSSAPTTFFSLTYDNEFMDSGA